MKELLFMEPVFKEAIWGGSRLHDVYGYEIPSDHTGECWAIGAHKNGDCRIAAGEYRGLHLSKLWAFHPELFGDCGPVKEFPLLIKIIDAKRDLSIQVHPDNEYAAVHENGSLGKMECWYVLDCEPGGTIVIGHNAKNREEVREMIEERRWGEFIREIPVHPGDFFQINPGCVHAIKGGTLILETQQSSDITYRVYDYDRLSDGKPRQLHIKQSIDVIHAPYEADKAAGPRVERENENGRLTQLVTCPYYTCWKLEVHGAWEQEFGDVFANVSVLEGEGSVNGVPVKKGQHFIVPASFGVCRFEGEMMAIMSQPGQRG